MRAHGRWRRHWPALLTWSAIVVLAPALGAQRGPAIAAAASVNGALTAIARAFEHERGQAVSLVFGASGTLTRQIRDGAPFELLLAADEEFPAQLTAAGLTRDAGVVYAVGRLAIFAPTGSPLTADPALAGLQQLAKSGGVTRFAMANPEVAPYGRAAAAVLRKRALWDTLRPRLVFGDSIAQAAQFAVSGSTVGGLVAYSQVLAPEFAARGTHALIPDADYPPLRQRMVLLKRAGAVATAFYDYLRTPAARAVLRRHGFAVPD